MLPINSIYLGTEGEGCFVGQPQVFVRLQGCRIGCHNCDSKDTWAFSSKYLKKEKDVLDEIETTSRGIKKISLTGGDPLDDQIRSPLISLIQKLKKKGYFISLEAAGVCIVHEIFDLMDFINFDYKTPSTKVKTDASLIIAMAEHYKGLFQIKSVIEDKKDFDDVSVVYNNVRKTLGKMDFLWFLTPSYEKEPFPRKRFLDIIAWNEKTGGHFRVVGQQHKWFHGADKKQV